MKQRCGPRADPLTGAPPTGPNAPLLWSGIGLPTVFCLAFAERLEGKGKQGPVQNEDFLP